MNFQIAFLTMFLQNRTQHNFYKQQVSVHTQVEYEKKIQ